MKSIIQTHKQGQAIGIYSICSAHPLVIEAALNFNRNKSCKVLIEATSNQVNQFGGYTGMTPADFRDFVFQLADKNHFPRERLILGGDHLGPNCWQNEPAEHAMAKAADLIAAYVKAGFSKIHLDTSMACADDPSPLAAEIIAQRSAQLCQVAEQSASEQHRAGLCYVIGTEVPIPGGESHAIESLQVTSVASAQHTISSHQQAFYQMGLQTAFERVIAIVVQPGVEFDHSNVFAYQSEKAQDLARFIENTTMVYEAHSTDYQTANALRQLVLDHFAILKVGPALTFALREAIYALALIEKAVIKVEQQSQIMAVIESVLLDNPQYWQKYYHQFPSQYRIDLSYSLSDRMRYYWPDKRINHAVQSLITNLDSIDIPLGVLSQYMPLQFNRVLNHQCQATPQALIIDHIQDVFRQYAYGCQG